MVQDEDNNTDTDTAQVSIVSGNTQPSKPVLEGPSSYQTNTSYQLNMTTSDNEDSSITFLIDWGDDTPKETQVGASGEKTITTHEYTRTGFFTITVTAKDSGDKVSPEATKLVIISEGTVDTTEDNKEEGAGFPWVIIILIIIIIAVAIILILNRKEILAKETIMTVFRREGLPMDKQQTYELPNNQVEDFNADDYTSDITTLSEPKDQPNVDENQPEPMSASARIKGVDADEGLEEEIDNDNADEDESTAFKRI
jgi:hypothetical protein